LCCFVKTSKEKQHPENNYDLMKIYSKFYALLFIAIPFFSLAQKIKGKIIDEDTHTAIPYATVQSDAKQKTISNENGEFELNVSALPAQLNISHISYQSARLKVADTSLSEIKLKSVSLNLDEVSVGNYALTLMKDVLEKAKKTYKEPNYAKAFLRQVAYENSKPTYLNEIYFNADWRNYGLISWNPTQARYLKGKSSVSYTNISFFSLALSGYLFNTAHTKPLSPKLDSLYEFRVKSTYKSGETEIAVISCKPKIKIDKMFFEGDYYINTDTHDVLKIEGTINNFNLNISGPRGVKVKEVDFMAQYKINNEGKNVLDFSTLNIKSTLTVLGLDTKNTEFSSALYAIDYQNIYNKDLKDIQAKTNDVAMTKDMIYNQQFWNDNQTIKRTVREEEAIKSLEEVPKAKK
jgi:hypothetical protein